MNEFKTKAGVQPLPIVPLAISSTEVEKYFMESILGVTKGVKCDFTIWTGVSAEDHYVRMRVLMDPSVVLKNEKPEYYGDKILAEHSSLAQVRKDVVEALEPYMFPEFNGADVANMQRLLVMGLTGQRIEEIKRYRTLTYISEAGLFGIYLRPEKIIADMLTDPDGIETDRNIECKAFGTTSETIGWKVVVDRGCKTLISKDVSFDNFFRI